MTPSTPITNNILGLCLAVFLLQTFGGGQEFLLRHAALWPALEPRSSLALAGWPEFQPWQLLSYAFLHGGIAHIFFNLFGLWMFGRAVEMFLGPARMLFFMLICIFGAGLTQLISVSLSGDHAPTVGLSGGVMGLLPAFAWLFPRAKITLLFPPIPIPAPVFVALYAAIELTMGLTRTAPGIAHFAHLGGMIFGMIVLWAWWCGGEIRPQQ